ncbi:MAG: hypothetical protein ROO76_14810 [Terriglobia bacterium]|jgi:hypothetical protein|nr:hypothetical protein [Terriglobia bacterium]
MTRTERWLAIIFFGVALFGADGVVRAISPPLAACVRNGMTGLLKRDTPRTRKTINPAPQSALQQNPAK